MYTGLNVLREAHGLDDERLYPRGFLSTTSDLSLFLSIRLGGELALWAAINIDVGTGLNLLNAILEEVSSTMTLTLDINSFPVVSGDITLDMHILKDGDGYSDGGGFYFERSHGL